MFAFDYWKMLTGLGIFLLGMHLIEISIKDLSGKTFRWITRDYKILGSRPSFFSLTSLLANEMDSP
jgi:hypothetical protein